MDAKGPGDTVQRYFDEVINRRQLSLIGELFTTDCVFTSPRRVGIGPRVMISNYLGEWMNAFPDLKAHDIQLLAHEDTVAVRVVLKGCQAKPFSGFTGNGRHLSLPCYYWFEFRDGKICQMDVMYDAQILFSELGWGEPRALR